MFLCFYSQCFHSLCLCSLCFISLCFISLCLCVLCSLCACSLAINTSAATRRVSLNFTYSHTYAIPRVRVPIFHNFHVPLWLLPRPPTPPCHLSDNQQTTDIPHRQTISHIAPSSHPHDKRAITRFKPCSHMPACICPTHAANARKSPFRPVPRVA